MERGGEGRKLVGGCVVGGCVVGGGVVDEVQSGKDITSRQRQQGGDSGGGIQKHSTELSLPISGGVLPVVMPLHCRRG